MTIVEEWLSGRLREDSEEMRLCCVVALAHLLEGKTCTDHFLLLGRRFHIEVVGEEVRIVLRKEEP